MLTDRVTSLFYGIRKIKQFLNKNFNLFHLQIPFLMGINYSMIKTYLTEYKIITEY